MRAARAAAVLLVLGGFYYWSYRVFLGSFFAYDDFWVLRPSPSRPVCPPGAG
jgi:hypothetical protein